MFYFSPDVSGMRAKGTIRGCRKPVLLRRFTEGGHCPP